jgi:hypothetical protein
MDKPTFIESYSNGASDDYCDRMIQRWEDLNSGKKSSCNGRMDGQITNGDSVSRKDYAYFFDIDAHDLAEETYHVLNRCLEQYLQKYPSLGSFNLSSTHIKVQKTPPKGGFHTWHCEQRGLKDALRILTWTIYLNDMPEGEAETEFLEYGIKVPAKKGMVCIFPAAWTHTHRGNAVYSHDKYIATGWYYGQEGDSY